MSNSGADAGHSLLQSGRAQRASLKTAVYRVMRWLALVISKYPSWLQWVITGILEIPITLVPFHSGYGTGKGCSRAIRGWLIIPALVSHLGQATGAPGTVSAAPHLSHAKVPGTVKGHLTAKLITQRPRPDENSWDCGAVQERGGGNAQHTLFLSHVILWFFTASRKITVLH